MEHIKSKPFFLKDEEHIYPADKGITRQFVGYNNEIMTVKVIFEKGAIGYQHSHPHVQTAYIESGVYEVTINGETKTLKAGDGFFAEPNIMHGLVCLEAGVIIDNFSPVREDFYKTINPKYIIKYFFTYFDYSPPNISLKSTTCLPGNI